MVLLSKSDFQREGEPLARPYSVREILSAAKDDRRDHLRGGLSVHAALALIMFQNLNAPSVSPSGNTSTC